MKILLEVENIENLIIKANQENLIKKANQENRENQREDAYNITVKLYVNNANSISSSWML